jgi:hypothetical protein
MKTAVEWLDEQLQIMESKSFNNIIQIEMGRDNYKEIIEQAKEMEKEKMIDFAENYEMWESENYPRKTFEQYYNETFKSE